MGFSEAAADDDGCRGTTPFQISTVSSDRSGFTLIEIAVALSIIGILLLLVIPRMPSSEMENLKISARTFASTLRYLQDRGATSRVNYFINISPGTDSVKVFEITGGGAAKEPSDPMLRRGILKDGVQIADVVSPHTGKVVDGQFRLDAGSVGVRDFVTIHLRSSGGKFWTLMAFPAGGKVKLYEGYQEEPE